ncbi:M23 family metallopeptidase [Thiomicrorhabdus aquaedulcis]|uniref:M23 family metallopeptidase n=1 Tax=Thiomicrorhabdus aquaedulcis TaxID=2211106 RepID=UPI00156223A8|nr:M23 family metallopeptidase [Thiomicrorhabdus aquaedulcis]
MSWLVGCTSATKYPNRTNNVTVNKATAAKLTLVKGASYPCKSPYTVVPGDTLSSIAYRCKVDMGQLAKVNELSSPYLLYAKQELDMPLNEPISRLETLSKNQQATSVRSSNPEASHSAQGSVKNSSVRAESTHSSKWLWPTDGAIKSAFVRDAAGLSVLEVYGQIGLPIRAVASGKVVYAGDGIVNFGWMAVLKHDDGYMSIYAHNSQLNVKEGDAVKAGDTIATLGRSGSTKTPKLYLEARYQGRKVSINTLLKK